MSRAVPIGKTFGWSSLYTIDNRIINTSVIKQKRESQNGGNKKTKHAKFPEKRLFLTS